MTSQFFVAFVSPMKISGRVCGPGHQTRASREAG
jgi:hypothetical protein